MRPAGPLAEPQRPVRALLASSLVAWTMAGASLIPAAGASPDAPSGAPAAAPLPTPRPDGAAPAVSATPPEPPAPSPPSMADCRRQLAARGARFEPAEPPEPAGTCAVTDPVRLRAIADGSLTIDLPDRPLLSCAFALVLTGFSRDLIIPLARAMAAGGLVAFGTGPGYACRPRNREAGARPSAHGRGEAIDISWFVLADGRRVQVGEAAADPAAARFVGTVRRAACGWFTTVLGPGADAAHADHLHLDIERRGRSGDHRLCQ